MKNLLKMLPYIREEYKRLIIVTIASLFLAGVSALQPLVFKSILDSLVKQVATPAHQIDFRTPFLYMIGLSVTYLSFSHIFNIYSEKVVWSVRLKLRTRIFTKITGLSLDYFETHQAGAIAQRAGESIMQFSDWLRTLAFSFLGPIFTLIFITIVLFTRSFWLGLIGVGITLTSYLEYAHTRRVTRKPNVEWKKYGERSSGIFNETISNMSTIATIGRIDEFRGRYEQTQTKMINIALGIRQKWNYSLFRKSIFNEIAYISGIAVTVWLVLDQKASIGDLLALTSYLSMIRGNASSFAQFIPLTDEADVSAERLIEMLEQDPTLPDSPDAVPLKRLDSIEFKNVSFTYPEGKKGAVSNISFKIEAGHNIALVGPSGVGKSTITKLILRFYAPTSGSILINDLPVENFTIDSIRQHVGMVMQDVALFNASVKDNLKLAQPKATMADLELAAEQAHADEFIEELPKQYNTIVGERGVKLSGGQKQRIAIARAILKNSEFIILDEATSALDSESEKYVQEGLTRLREGRSSLTIAHRLSTVRHADEILVLKGGKITERGTHPELIKKPKGLYKKLFDLQSATGKVSL